MKKSYIRSYWTVLCTPTHTFRAVKVYLYLILSSCHLSLTCPGKKQPRRSLASIKIGKARALLATNIDNDKLKLTNVVTFINVNLRLCATEHIKTTISHMHELLLTGYENCHHSVTFPWSLLPARTMNLVLSLSENVHPLVTKRLLSYNVRRHSVIRCPPLLIYVKTLCLSSIRTPDWLDTWKSLNCLRSKQVASQLVNLDDTLAGLAFWWEYRHITLANVNR